MSRKRITITNKDWRTASVCVITDKDTRKKKILYQMEGKRPRSFDSADAFSRRLHKEGFDISERNRALSLVGNEFRPVREETTEIGVGAEGIGIKGKKHKKI